MEGEEELPTLSMLAENVLLSTLAKMAASIQARFCCTGAVNLPNDRLHLYFRDSTSQPHVATFPVESAEQQQELKPLLTACSKATFGRGREEVLDKDYRDALKLDASHFALDFHPCEALIAEDIHRAMMPEARAIRLETYKLNVYGPGGRFKSHVDTPRSPDMFGSLVVCLPTVFSGGELTVHHPLSSAASSSSSSSSSSASSGSRQDQVVVDWSSTAEAPNQMRWAAFYSDCEHEILPVTDGHRVTITYNLYAIEKEDEEAQANQSEPQEKPLCRNGYGCWQTNNQSHSEQYRHPSANPWDELKDQGRFSFLTEMVPLPLRNSFLEALSCAAFMKDGGMLGFACQHLYPHTWYLYNKRMASILKGADAVLFATASALGLSVKVVPLYENDEKRRNEEQEGRRHWWEEEEGEEEEGGEAKQETILRPTKGRYALLAKFYEPHIDSHDERNVQVETIEDYNITWVSKPRKTAWREFAAQRVVYGNEPGTLENDYQAVAILVTIPEWDSEARSQCTIANTLKKGEVKEDEAEGREKRKREEQGKAEEEEKEKKNGEAEKDKEEEEPESDGRKRTRTKE